MRRLTNGFNRLNSRLKNLTRLQQLLPFKTSRGIRIGTSGWHYKHWRGPFYPADLPTAQMLPFYVRHFDSVEINNSFYRLLTLSGLQKWRDMTPMRFCFAFKASRYLTPMKQLKELATGLARFLMFEPWGKNQLSVDIGLKNRSFFISFPGSCTTGDEPIGSKQMLDNLLSNAAKYNQFGSRIWPTLMME